jgi:hypothetical protein
MTYSKLALPALLMSSVLASQAKSEPVFSGNFGLAYNEGSGASSAEAFEVLDRIRFNHRLVADNGITFGARVDLDDRGTAEEIDEAFVFLGGDFGRIHLGDADESVANVRRPDGFVAGGCTRRNDDGSYQIGSKFRLDGLSLKVGYLGFLDDSKRSALATEDGLGNVVNPSSSFDYSLKGLYADARIGYCYDTGRLFPTKLGATFSFTDLGADDSFQNQALPYGLGITGVGYAPGVFINAPTDIRYGNFSVDRTSFGGGLEIVHPIGVAMPRNARSGSLGVPFAQNEVLRINSAIFGVNFDFADQDERAEFLTDTPDFGAGSAANVRYDTSFDVKTFGVYAGLQQERHAINGNGVTTSGYLRTTVGYSFVDVEAFDRVQAIGLGGALNMSNGNRFSESDGMETFSVSAGLSRTKDNLSGGFTVAAQYGGLPLIDYFRPDSTGGGVPLDPEIDVDGDWSFRIGASVRLSF